MRIWLSHALACAAYVGEVLPSCGLGVVATTAHARLAMGAFETHKDRANTPVPRREKDSGDEEFEAVVPLWEGLT